MSQLAKLLRPALEAAKPLLPVGPAHAEQLRRYLRSGVFFGAAGAVLGCYMMEWKAVLQYLPYYNGKYKVEEE